MGGEVGVLLVYKFQVDLMSTSRDLSNGIGFSLSYYLQDDPVIPYTLTHTM